METVDIENIESDIDNFSEQMYQLMKVLYPICRSITGNGVRQTHNLLREIIPIETKEVPSHTKVLDWTIPKEWNINDAYIKDPSGVKIIDFKNLNLHVVNYSRPIKKKISLSELKPHIHTLPEQPDLIPYVTMYYKDDWGFCMPHKQFLQLKEGEYEVVIDSSLEDGSLTYSEYFLEGELDDEILISTYTCHPSLCNDNLSGIVLTTFLANILSKVKRKYSYRFLFIPETIGAITWLALNEQQLSKIKYGSVVNCVGNGGDFIYKKTRAGNTQFDSAVINVLKNSNYNYSIEDFVPTGSDERQFSSPGFNLAIGNIMRTYDLNFPEYHTSGDNFDLVKGKFLGESLLIYLKTIFILENNSYFLSCLPKGEPQLGKRGLYNLVGTKQSKQVSDLALLWILNFSDGTHSLLDISEKSNIDFETIKKLADLLIDHQLIKEDSRK